MKNILLFNGAISRANDTSEQILNHFQQEIIAAGAHPVVFNLKAHEIPFFDPSVTEIPENVQEMIALFRNCEQHIWLTPLYHGGIVGAMKNCIDWLVFCAKEPEPYLSGKLIGLVCWAYGGNAASGIDNLRTIVATLRAWNLPYSIPIIREDLFDASHTEFTPIYTERFQRLLTQLLQTAVSFKS